MKYRPSNVVAINSNINTGQVSSQAPLKKQQALNTGAPLSRRRTTTFKDDDQLWEDDYCHTAEYIYTRRILSLYVV
jgi:hypothetical protein